MLTKKVIETLYRKFNRRPESVYDLNLSLLFDYLMENHGLELDEEFLTINSIEPESPFHAIPLRHIHEIVEFGDDIAIILHSSIIFLGKHTPSVYIHLKEASQGILPKIFGRLGAVAV